MAADGWLAGQWRHLPSFSQDSLRGLNGPRTSQPPDRALGLAIPCVRSSPAVVVGSSEAFTGRSMRRFEVTAARNGGQEKSGVGICEFLARCYDEPQPGGGPTAEVQEQAASLPKALSCFFCLFRNCGAKTVSGPILGQSPSTRR
jgi:hypothetical protein